MSKKLVSTCDRCKAKFADFSIHVRDAKTNMELKLTTGKTETEKPGPFDLCRDCLTEVVGCITKGPCCGQTEVKK